MVDSDDFFYSLQYQLQEPYDLKTKVALADQPLAVAALKEDFKQLETKVPISSDRLKVYINSMLAKGKNLSDLGEFIHTNMEFALQDIAMGYLSHQTGFYHNNQYCHTSKEALGRIKMGINELTLLVEEEDLRALFAKLSANLDQIIENRFAVTRPTYTASRFK